MDSIGDITAEDIISPWPAKGSEEDDSEDYTNADSDEDITQDSDYCLSSEEISNTDTPPSLRRQRL